MTIKIQVKRANNYWHSDGTSEKVVPDDEVELSDDLYLCNNEIIEPSVKSTKIVRLISGIEGSTELGYHFHEDWVTDCPINAEYAIFRGVHKTKIQKVDETNNSLFEILKEV